MNDSQAIIVPDRISGPSHSLNEGWLRSRVRGWMELVESAGLAYWIGTYTADGKWIYCSSSTDLFQPKAFRQEYARSVVRHLNAQISTGGAWLAGWVRGGREFYLLWKDADGDIQIPIECDKPFIVLRNYTVTDWERHATVALGIWSEHRKNMEFGRGQQKNVAQGEKVSEGHEANVPKVVM